MIACDTNSWLPASLPRVARRLLLICGAVCAPAVAHATTPQEDMMLAAARDGNVPLFRQMIQYGASPYAQDASGNNAVVFAVEGDHEAILREVLRRKIDTNVRGSLGLSPLGMAVLRGNEQAAQRLLAAGADPDLADANGITPLASAVRLGYDDLARLLLRAGSDTNLADRDGITPLHLSCQSGDLSLVTELLVRGADPNRLDRESRSPLFIALLNGHPAAAEILIRNHHTNVEQLTQGYTPRHWTIAFEQPELASLIDQRLRH
ncbi:MAG: ankyrin repeat domain-containing protein [Burkholderiaceae bacterium]|nr:ankyrin repeat domain-containing protein [Burkholderiaceae bacterium]